METLQKIKAIKTEIANKQAVLSELEFQLMGTEELIHTPVGFKAYVRKAYELVSWYDFDKSTYWKKAGIKMATVPEGNPWENYMKYGKWYLYFAFSKNASGFYIEVQKFKEMRKGRTHLEPNYLKLDSEVLIKMTTDTIDTFKDGKYIDFIIKEVINKLIKHKTDLQHQKKLAEIAKQQENFKSIDF